MATERHCIILPHLGSYMIRDSAMGDQLQGPYPTKVAAIAAAEATLMEAGADPDAVVDMTDRPEAEVREYLR